MAGRKELREENRNAAAAAAAAAQSVAVTDALLLATMCIIGLPVEVHVKDGSVYSGIFHTASVDDDYAIVLREARMKKKGNSDPNIVKGSLIETLIVQSDNLVQVVAKGLRFPSDGITGYVEGDGVQATAGRNGSLDREGNLVKPNESKGKKKHKRQTRFSGRREKVSPYSSTDKTTNVPGSSLEGHNDRLDSMKFVKIEEDSDVLVDGRQVVDGSLEIQSGSPDNPRLQNERTTNDVQGSSLSIAGCEAHSTVDLNIPEDKHMLQTPIGVSSGKSTTLEDQGQERSNSDDTACTASSPPNVSINLIPVFNVNSESRLSASANSFLSVPPKSSSFNRTAKESKLNPGAKLFSPMLHHRSGTPPMVPNGASYSYVPDTYTMAPIATAQQEVDASSFPRSSVPVKFVAYNNVTVGNGGNDTPYVQPMIGQVVSRTQPVRYAGQYHNFQTGPTYIHQNPQNVMFGRVGPLVCMHPISNDVVQTATGFSPATTRPHLTPHPVHFPKHQGNGSAQALQMYMTPQIIANGAQRFEMQNSIPISQPIFPMLRPIAVPGLNGFSSTKFA
ncbi:hypothetical protein ACJIZ3_006946 [Penstemon smallii]|uniref:Ataxin 2 SM domain-containing protein n=1 Tax=Penstemon smallii TaxID=265156 RepID=A0ABD3S9D0_9LAMI